MIKAVATTRDGRELLILGLSFRNLEKFKEAPGDSFIRIDGRELGLPVDVLIFSGETEETMTTQMAQFIGPQTKVHR